MRHPEQACYIHCCQRCVDVAKSLKDDADGGAGGDVAWACCRQMMARLAALPEDALRREPTDSMSAFVLHVRKQMLDEGGGAPAAGSPKARHVLRFWLALTLNYVRSSSLPLRLFGWEQVMDVIEVARLARPPAPRYEVCGAGSSAVNGVYEYAAAPGEVPKYCKIDARTGTTITLFRCTMRSRAKWWFLSEVMCDLNVTSCVTKRFLRLYASHEHQSSRSRQTRVRLTHVRRPPR